MIYWINESWYKWQLLAQAGLLFPASCSKSQYQIRMTCDALFLSQRHSWGRMFGWSHGCVTDLPQSTSLPNPEGHNSGSFSLLFRQLHCCSGDHGRILEDWSLTPLPPPWPSRAWGGYFWTSFLPSALLFSWIFTKLISSVLFPIGCACCWLAISSQIQVQVLTRGF